MCIDIQNMWDGWLAQDLFVEKRRYALLFTVTEHFRTSLVISCIKDITEKIMRILYCLKMTSILKLKKDKRSPKRWNLDIIKPTYYPR